MQHEICKIMKIQGFPTVIMGTAAQFLTAHKDGPDKSGVHIPVHENAKPTKDIVHDILDYFAIEAIPVPDFPPAQAHAPPNTATPQAKPAQRNKTADAGAQRRSDSSSNATQGADGTSGNAGKANSALPTRPVLADARDIVSATLQTYHEMLEADADLPNQRVPFVAFWSLCASSHPVPACRRGARTLLDALPRWWPPAARGGGSVTGSVTWSPPPEMLSHEICGEDERNVLKKAQPYYACVGSVQGSRGYTCGLWMLLHSLSTGCVRLPLRNATVPCTCYDAFIESFNAAVPALLPLPVHKTGNQNSSGWISN